MNNSTKRFAILVLMSLATAGAAHAQNKADGSATSSGYNVTGDQKDYTNPHEFAVESLKKAPPYPSNTWGSDFNKMADNAKKKLREFIASFSSSSKSMKAPTIGRKDLNSTVIKQNFDKEYENRVGMFNQFESHHQNGLQQNAATLESIGRSRR